MTLHIDNIWDLGGLIKADYHSFKQAKISANTATV